MLAGDNSTCPPCEVFTMLSKYRDSEFAVGFLRPMVRGCLAALMLAVLTQHAQATTQTTTMVIQNQTGTVVTGLNISTTSGPCIQIINSTNITIEQSQIGPCGTNASTTASQGIYVSGSSANIYDNYIHVENQAATCNDDSHDNIFITNSSNNVNIQGNVIAYGEANIKVEGASSNVSAIGNFLLNPRGVLSCGNSDNVGGDQFQSWGASPTQPNTSMTVSNNSTVSAKTGYLYPANSSDQINFGNTSGIIAQNNWVNGAQYANACGITIDYGSNSAQITGNIVNNTYNCGIAIATGTNHWVSANKVLITGGGRNASGIAI